MTVVGDIHGQVQDLLHIFHLNGLPSAKNAYIFNGDWVDRGQWGCEVVLIVFAFKILFPKSVFLNRGNHEAVDINDFSGFLDECKEKYDEDVYEEFNHTFAACPLATVVNDRVFVVHGGLPRTDAKVADLQRINRNIMEVDYEHPDHCLLADLIWSDPEEGLRGRVSNERRGAGQLFGKDVLQAFLQRNGLRCVVRSHEAKQGGYETMWDDTLITVFSASNYCGTQGNDGAVLVFESDLTRKIITWNLSNTSLLAASGVHERFNLQVSAKDSKRVSLKNVLIMKLARLIQSNRLPLIDAFEAVSTNGLIQRSKWAAVLRRVLELPKIPFLMFQSMLRVPSYGVDAKIRGPIDYTEWLLAFTSAVNLGSAATTPAPQREFSKSQTRDAKQRDAASGGGGAGDTAGPAGLVGRADRIDAYLEKVIFLLTRGGSSRTPPCTRMSLTESLLSQVGKRAQAVASGATQPIAVRSKSALLPVGDGAATMPSTLPSAKRVSSVPARTSEMSSLER